MQLVKGTIMLAGTGDKLNVSCNQAMTRIGYSWDWAGTIANIPGTLKADLENYYDNSSNAKALIDYFKNKNMKVLAVCSSTLGTAPMGERATRFAGLTVNTAGQEPYHKGDANPAKKIPLALCILHEMGHLWQRQTKENWYEKQIDFSQDDGWGDKTKTKWKAVGQAFLTLDHNNLQYWEHPICNDMSIPKRESYYLFQPSQDLANDAKGKWANVGTSSETVETKFFKYMYVGSTKQWKQTHVLTRPPNNWKNGAPTRIIL